MNRNISKVALATLILLLFVGAAFGAPITTYNTNAAGGHGFYSGTGGVDGGFTTTTNDYGNGNGISVSVRAAQRFVGPIIPTGNNYTCISGMQCNVDWSIEALGSMNLSNFTFNLTITSITNGNQFISFDPTNVLLGGSYWDPNTGEVMVWNPTVVGNQNSEYLGFQFIANLLGGWTATDQVTAVLTATPNDNNLVGVSAQANINPSSDVPEPMSFVLMGAGLVGIAFLRRRSGA